jgi:hypothetical protein
MMAALKHFTVISLVAASVATPLIVYSLAQAKWHERDEFLRRLAGQLAELTAENEHLSDLVAEAKTNALSRDQLTELLRLRGQIRSLREKTNAIQRLQNENQGLQAGLDTGQNPKAAQSEAELSKELAAETIDVMKNVFAELQSALKKFADDHKGRAPNSFSQLRNYFPVSAGKRMPGLYTFEFIRDDAPRPDDVLILREARTRRTPEGKLARVYAFSDGTVVEVYQADDDDFDVWEKARAALPSAAGQ